MSDRSSPPGPPARAEVALSARGLVKHFEETRAVDGVDLRVERGEIRGLLGPNGAGKTTLMRMLFGLVRPDRGSVALLGKKWDWASSPMVQGVAGFVETPSLYPYLSGRKNLQLLAELDGGVPDGRVDEVLELVRLSRMADRKAGQYSSGMRQRLGLAAVLLHVPEVLILDEPSIGLDPVGARDIRALLLSLALDGTAVLFSSHNVVEVEGLCRTVTIMRSGQVVWNGTLDRLRAEAPAPAHVVWTSDDDRAAAVAERDHAVSAIRAAAGGITLQAEQQALDDYVIALGREGVAVRRLELLMSPLESMFFELTGARSSAETSPADDEPEEETDDEKNGETGGADAESLGASQ